MVLAATALVGHRAASVGPTRLARVSLARGCQLSLRLPHDLRAAVDRNDAHLLTFTSPWITQRVRAACVLGRSAGFMRVAVNDPGHTIVRRLRDGAIISTLTVDGGSVNYLVDIRGGSLFIAPQQGDVPDPELAYVIQHAHGGFPA